jgi:hypothetical protein
MTKTKQRHGRGGGEDEVRDHDCRGGMVDGGGRMKVKGEVISGSCDGGVTGIPWVCHRGVQQTNGCTDPESSSIYITTGWSMNIA